jgi:CTP:molybdopterin cytidylyltransferase MocA
MKAVITAGGRVDAAFAAEAGTSIKALAEIRGISMLARTIEALRACGVNRIAVVGDSPVRDAVRGRVEAMIEGGETGTHNVMRALRAWPEDGDRLLYLTSDMPYVDAASLRDFIDRSPDEALTIPLTEYSAFAKRFPNAPPFGIELDGERIVNGGAFHIPPGGSARLVTFASAFFEARKAPWKMASLAGPQLLVRFVLRKLRIAHVEARARAVLGIPVAAVRNAAAELAYDADSADEYRYARTHW